MTLDFYNKNAEEYFKKTKKVNMQLVYDKFEKYLSKDSYILDLGCGSGRDSKYFLERGYKVDAIDGSLELCKLASEYIGIKVQYNEFKNIKFDKKYNAIWACASLLHITMKDLKEVYFNLYENLNSNGIFYSSFKYGDSEEIVDEKYYNNMNEEKIGQLLKGINQIDEINIFYNYEKRAEDYMQKWINLIVKKANY